MTNYFKKQSEIDQSMRAIVIDWLVDVHRKYKLRQETLFITLSLMDRFLEKNHISKEIFQLVAAAALFIATKYEEIYPPTLENFLYICADAYTKDDIVKMEGLILGDIQFGIVFTSSFSLMSHYAIHSSPD